MSLARGTGLTLSGGIYRLAMESCSCTDSTKYYLPQFRLPACTLGWHRRPNSSSRPSHTRSTCLAALLCSDRGAAAAAIASSYTEGVPDHGLADSGSTTLRD